VKKLKKCLFPMSMFVIVLALGLLFPSKRHIIAQNVMVNVREMLSIIPPIFVLIGLFDVYVPRETVVKYMGEKSFVKGTIFAFLLGSFLVGPLYIAFPIASMMLKKGASFFNIVVFLGASSTMKIPQFLCETAFLGASFSVTRWITNVFVILGMAAIINLAITEKEKGEIVKRQFSIERDAYLSQHITKAKDIGKGCKEGGCTAKHIEKR